MTVTDFLKQKVGVFRDFSPARLHELEDGSHVQSFEANEAIIHGGSEATHMGVILSGMVSVSASGDGGVRQSLGHLNAGETFGELALMTGQPAPADVIADSHCDVMLIPVSLFQSVIVAEPGGVQQISRVIADRMKSVLADPAKAAAALRTGEDPYGLNLK